MYLNKKISVLFLVHNEVATIEEDIIKIKNSLNGYINYEIIVVQDGSTDGTYEKLEEIREKYSIKLNSIKNRRGYTQAFLDGVKDCDEEVIFFLIQVENTILTILKNSLKNFLKKKLTYYQVLE